VEGKHSGRIGKGEDPDRKEGKRLVVLTMSRIQQGDIHRDNKRGNKLPSRFIKEVREDRGMRAKCRRFKIGNRNRVRKQKNKKARSLGQAREAAYNSSAAVPTVGAKHSRRSRTSGDPTEELDSLLLEKLQERSER